VKPIASADFSPKQQQYKAPTLLDAPGAVENDGKTIVWGGAQSLYGLTSREIELVKQKLGTKSIDYIRTEQIKGLMASKSCAEIVQHFRGRKGYRSSVIKHTHAALSQAKQENDRNSGAK
jgi:hypothetical protein